MQVLREMEPVHLTELVGREWIFVGVHDATLFCMQRLAEKVRVGTLSSGTCCSWEVWW